MGLLSLMTLMAAAVLCIPVVVFFLEVAAAILLPRPRSSPTLPTTPRPRIAVIVPAHNESTGLLPTIADVKAQLMPGDRLLVVADNCTDDTAAVAARAGAGVVVRDDTSKFGKGFALDWGIRHLEPDPPDIVVILDADCRLASDAISVIADTAAATGRPAQALYLMKAPKNPSLDNNVAEFAWRVKNWSRPLGLHKCHLPCQLMGSGMAFPWSVIRPANWQLHTSSKTFSWVSTSPWQVTRQSFVLPHS